MNENMTIPAEDLDARYAEAEEICHHSANVDKIAEARDIFRALGDHRESRAYLEKCEAYLSWGEGAVVEYGHSNGAPIRWRVLEVDGRNRLLMAEKPVAYLPYNNERDHANWSQCSLRRWLNKDFMEQCFTMPERMDILLTPVRNDTEERWKVENGPNTRDKAFVFNQPEIEHYFPTPEQRAIGEWYWLRGHGWSMLSPMAVYVDGSFYEYGVNKNNGEIGVRPAIWVRKKVL